MTESLRESLRRSDPDRLVNATATYVAERFPGCRMDVLLADYRIAGLWPVLQADHVSAGLLADISAATRAYASQETVTEPGPDGTFRMLIPMCVWAERVGVLVAEMPAVPDRAIHDDLQQVADDLTVAILAADRATDRYRRARRRRRLTMAAEMQWEMLPGRALGGPNFSLAGQLEPAYAVCGDHFDWSLNDDRLTITALNGDGNGLSATLLSVVAVNAMRNARRSGADLKEQAELASDAIFSIHGGQRHVATLLVEIDLADGSATVIDAGSPRLLRLRGNRVQRIQLDDQLPLGMFADARYAVQKFTLEPQDRLFILSDGVHAAAPGEQAAFGERALLTAVRATRLSPATEAVAGVMRELDSYHDSHHLADDAVTVCLDWLGPAGGGAHA
ncbi:MAG TPA: PP2C family protein-serine/threonine phosphatase [Micromonosporaceae bacterium]|jgi:serine phosphatase RsbU (regulator of sigma subunit)